MSLEPLFRLGRRLPEPVRARGRPVVNYLVDRYYRWRGYPLAGPLEGLRMRGPILGTYRAGEYEPEVVRLIHRLVRPGDQCADAGAHLGYFTLLLARLCGENGRVTAFEAHPGTVRRLRSNVSLNGFGRRVRVEHLAVSGGPPGSIPLFSGRRYGHHGVDYSSLEWNVVGHDVEGVPTLPAMRVPAASLDDYYPPGSRLDLLKMDIEGAEAQAIPGMRRLLREARPLVLLEFHGEEGWAERRVLFEAGYHLYGIEPACRLPDRPDLPRVYQCLAVPAERPVEFPLP